jgi:hypothetical protein
VFLRCGSKRAGSNDLLTTFLIATGTLSLHTHFNPPSAEASGELAASRADRHRPDPKKVISEAGSDLSISHGRNEYGARADPPPFQEEIEGIEFDKIFDPETNSALLRARRIE